MARGIEPLWRHYVLTPLPLVPAHVTQDVECPLLRGWLTANFSVG
jgi:hypothetical protein